MLNKITKVICTGIIIWLNGLCAWGNRIDVFYEGGPTLVAEGIDGVELPQELSDPSHDLWDEYDPYVKFVGIRLNLPQELIQACEDKRWIIYNESKKQELEKLVATEKEFHIWCDKQENVHFSDHYLRNEYAYVFKIANQRNYFISDNFCKKIKLNVKLSGFRMKNSHMYDTQGTRYLQFLEGIIRDCFCNEFHKK